MIKKLIGWYQMKKRGERRVAPQGARGRVFEKVDGSSAGASVGQVEAEGRGKATLKMKVTRADGTVEHYEAPASVERLTNS